MSLVFSYHSDPFRNMWRGFERPVRVIDQHYLMGLDDDFRVPVIRGYVVRPRSQSVVKRSGVSEVSADEEKLQVNLDVAHFTPDDITVKVVDNFVVVEAKHEEKQDEHGYVLRHFTRRYAIPEDANKDQISCQLTPDGVLAVQVPRNTKPDVKERVIPIRAVEKTAASAPNPASTDPPTASNN